MAPIVREDIISWTNPGPMANWTHYRNPLEPDIEATPTCQALHFVIPYRIFLSEALPFSRFRHLPEITRYEKNIIFQWLVNSDFPHIQSCSLYIRVLIDILKTFAGFNFLHLFTKNKAFTSSQNNTPGKCFCKRVSWFKIYKFIIE